MIAALLVALALPAFASAAEPGGISGEVTEAQGGAAAAGVRVCASDEDQSVFSCVKTEADGSYEITGLPAGEYEVTFNASETGLDLIFQGYPGQVQVVAGSTTEGINAAMQPGGSISGLVTAAAGGTPVAEVLVCAFGPGGEWCDETGLDGRYEIEGLAGGGYTVEFWALEGFEFQVYPGGSSYSEAVPVPVTVGADTPNINAALFRLGSVSGHVYTASNHLPAVRDTVCVFGATDGEIYGCERTGSAGSYSFEVPAGSYKVGFSLDLSEYFPHEFAPEPDGFASQFWNLKPTLAQADTIVVPRATPVVGIDGLLGYVPPPTPPPAGPVVSPVVPKPRPALKCKKHFRRVVKRGSVRCVRVHKHHRQHKKRHGRHAGRG